MVRSPCCEKVGLKKGPWTPEEDQKLLAHIEQHGHGSWRALPLKAGLQRCGKSCRLRWTNYLRPDIKRGNFSPQEEQTIIQLHALLGNRWAAIATHLEKRTDNEIKNHWNTHLRKRLERMGIDPTTHKAKTSITVDGNGHYKTSKEAATLSHMAQWETARLEAEARLVRESNPSNNKRDRPRPPPVRSMSPTRSRPRCLDVLRAWQGLVAAAADNDKGSSLESPTSILSFPLPEISPTPAAGAGAASDPDEVMMSCGIVWSPVVPSYAGEESVGKMGGGISDVVLGAESKSSGDQNVPPPMIWPAAGDEILVESCSYWNGLLNSLVYDE
ncbi:unnamed protein product [Linum tenue]|uniref:Uncharacterized protein n=1 Tax=Linum tenue TaxID=586396 RepID=A0AAV0I1W9_9ROSI|nr:unnamed protein product [Linum tenue]CAI0391050.1 unnamed protein product [Linum tenue]